MRRKVKRERREGRILLFEYKKEWKLGREGKKGLRCLKLLGIAIAYLFA